MHAVTIREFLLCDPPLENTMVNILKIVDRFFCKEKYWLSGYRRSTCNAWQHIWLCCFGEVRNSSGLVTHCFLHWHQRHCQLFWRKSCLLAWKLLIPSEQELWTITFWKGFVKKWEHNMKFLITHRFTGSLEDKYWSDRVEVSLFFLFLWGESPLRTIWR